MIMLRDIYDGKNICAFNNETDAFEMVMALVESEEYETYLFQTLCNGLSHNTAMRFADLAKRSTIEALYLQEFPYIKGNFPHLKESE